jgi:hypothetical protein
MSWFFGISTTSRAIPTVEAALRKRKWKYVRVSDDMILTGVESDSGKYSIVLANETGKKTLQIAFNKILAGEDLHNLLRNGRLPVFCVHESAGDSAGEVAAVCERLMAENYRIAVGRFERDPEDGEIRFVITIPYRDRFLSIDQVDWSLSLGIRTLDRVMPQLHRMVGR